MKRMFYVVAVLLSLFASSLYALEPIRVSHFGNAGGTLVINLVNASTGSVEFSENHGSVNPDPNGLITVMAGLGTATTGNWSTIASTSIETYHQLQMLINGTIVSSLRLDRLIRAHALTGLYNFDESNYTYSGKTGVKLEPVNDAANVDIVLQPKGTGAIIAQEADGTSVGGNNRGEFAVDMQMNRINSTQVASGISSTISGGDFNTASNQGATVSGGTNNTASNIWSTVGGGFANIGSGENSTVAGGSSNVSSADYCFVGGGLSNLATGEFSSVSGGLSNQSTGTRSNIAGGTSNLASAINSSVGGGESNQATGDNSTIGGGGGNIASGESSVVNGGESNTASGINSFTGSGKSNQAIGSISVVSGGESNIASGVGSVVSGGAQNNASGLYSSIPGGNDNNASGEYSFAGGFGNTAGSIGETVVGLYSTLAGGTANSFVATDRLFNVGNGVGSAVRSDAFTIYKNGVVEINDAYSLPNADGSNGQVLKTDGSGNVTWQNESGISLALNSNSVYAYNASTYQTFNLNNSAIDPTSTIIVSFGNAPGANLIIAGWRITSDDNLSIFLYNPTGASGNVTFNIKVLN